MSIFVAKLQKPSGASEKEVIHYRGEGFYIEVDYPQWEQIVEVVRAMDGSDFNDGTRLEMDYVGYPYLEVIGNSSMVAVLLYSKKDGLLFLEDTTCPQSEQFFTLSESTLPERFTYDVETALRVVKQFYDFGEAEDGLSWVKDADVQ